MNNKEQRYFADMRAAKDGSKLFGHAAVFDSFSEDLGFREIIKRGAFAQTLKQKPDVPLLINHEGLPLARTTSGTLRLQEDRQGLYFEADLDMNDPDAMGILTKVRRGDVSQMSFAFRVARDGQEWNGDRTERTLLAVDLADGDISCVTYPAYKSAGVQARSRELALQSFEEWQKARDPVASAARLAILRVRSI